MSTLSSAQVADWNDVRQSLARICASHDEFDHFFSGVFDRLEDLTSQLVRRQKAWLSDRDRAKDEMDRREEALTQDRREIDRQRVLRSGKQEAQAGQLSEAGR